MQHTLFVPIALSAILSFGPTSAPEPAAPAVESIAMPDSNPVPAAGIFQQTRINSLQVRKTQPTTILEQTSSGTVAGTIQGTFTDELRVAIKANGTFTAKFTLTCTCKVNGNTGVLTLEATDLGRIVSPTTARFSGRAVITKATGGLAGTRGSLAIHGVVDLKKGLSTYAYSGFIRKTP